MVRDASSAVTVWGTRPVTPSWGSASVLREQPAPGVTQVRMGNEVSREMKGMWGGGSKYSPQMDANMPCWS